MPGPVRHWGWPSAAAFLLVVVAAADLALRTRDCGLLGWDTYPIIISSRIQTWNDLLGTFTQELMAGRYEGHFYRPLLNLTFAADYALWGLRPMGYQLTNVLAFAGCAAALYFAARRLTGPGSVVAPLAVLIFFLLHPSHYEILPVPARRPESLCGLFMLLALATQLSPRALGARWPARWPALWTLLAIASKETGFVTPLLIFVAVALYSSRTPWSRSCWYSLIAAVPHAVAAGLLLAARLAVLGGVGGHSSTQVSEAFGRFPAFAMSLVQWLFLPQPVMFGSALAKVLPASLGIGVLAVLALAIWPGRATSDRGAAVARVRPALLVALLWLLLVGLAYAAAGILQPWYLLLLVAGLAMLVGVVAEWLVAGLRERRLPRRLASGWTLLWLVGLVIWQARYSPLVCKYDEWTRGTVASQTFLEQLKRDIAAAPDGAIVRASPFPMWVRPRPDRPAILGAAVLTDYSIQAWAELIFPQRRIRVRTAPQAAGEPPAPGEILVLLTRRMEGF